MIHQTSLLLLWPQAMKKKSWYLWSSYIVIMTRSVLGIWHTVLRSQWKSLSSILQCDPGNSLWGQIEIPCRLFWLYTPTVWNLDTAGFSSSTRLTSTTTPGDQSFYLAVIPLFPKQFLQCDPSCNRWLTMPVLFMDAFIILCIRPGIRHFF